MKIDFKLLHKFFFWNVLIMVLWVIGEIHFTGNAEYSTVFIPFVLTPIMYILEKKYKIYGFDDE